MALQKQPININFQKGLDLKTDPFQVQVGSFLALSNSVFTTSGRLTKRNGFQNISTLPNNLQSTLTTLNDNLIATGSNLYAYSADTDMWLNQGIVQPVQLNTLPLVRVSTSQSSPDTAIAPNGLVCLTYIDSSHAYYQVSDSVTGQQIVKRTALPSTAVCPRVFILGNYFIVTFLASVDHLQYIAIPLANPNNPRTVADFATDVASLNAGYDGCVANNRLFLTYGATTTVNTGYINTSLAHSSTTNITGTADLVTVTNDLVNFRIFISFWDSTSMAISSAAFDYSLVQRMATTTIVSSVTISELTSVASNGVQTVFYEVDNSYTYDSNIRTDYIASNTCTLPTSGTGTGTAGTPAVVLRSVGLASKAFISTSGTVYVTVVYGDTDQISATDNSNQPTYFLIDSTGAVYMKLAYANGGGYAKNQVLPSVSLNSDVYTMAYLNVDFLATVNKGTNLPAGTPVNAIYTQTGINLASFTLNTTQQHSSEIAGTLNLTGGILWEYDGVKPVENNFHVWPENVEATTATTGGFIAGGSAGDVYYYVFTYEWTNNQGNLERSAPSIPVKVDLSASGTSTNVNTIYVPTLRITYKIAPNPVRIVGYRWSANQQVYYQFTSLTSPTLNNTTIDYVTFTDTLADASILGNVILYTTGGVIENISAPASIDSTLFDNRLWLIDAEDQNLLWYSKQVIENVPVEMSDLLTLYVAPTTSAQGSTGKLTAIYPMDDKIILFKKDAAYYINGTGPDNTGANNNYSQPIFITAAVGCTNPNSIVLTPAGLMFQSDKGIWLLGRDLSTTYIGAPVETYNTSVVMSATAIPATTQVRFILDNSVTLMYDYFFQQWATHTNLFAISSTLSNGRHTYLNSYGQVLRETTGTYTDNSTPVLMSLTTSWINLAGLQGFERFYFAFLLGTYKTPFKLSVQLAYNYNPSAIQNVMVLPDNYTSNWGDEAVWGAGAAWGADSDPTGGTTANVFAARIFPSTQKCQSFQVSIQEVYDASFRVPAGEGLTLSGLNLIVGGKRGFRTQSTRKSFG